MISSSTRIRGKALGPLLSLLLCLVFIGLPFSAAQEFTDVQIPRMGDAAQPIPVHVNLTGDIVISEVKLYYEMSGWANPMVVYLSQTNGTTNEGTWSGEIPPLDEGGTLRCSVIVNGGIARYPAEGTVSIEVDGPGAGFPWKWIIIGGFLAFVLVMTELIFKPGIYRQTGRERARTLEEEDKKKEMENAEKSETEDSRGPES